MATYDGLPKKIFAGTAVRFTRSRGDYPASAGWTAKLVLAGAVKLVFPATVNADGDSFDFTLPATETGAPLPPATDQLIAGIYKAFEKYENATTVDSDIVDLGVIEIQADPETAEAGALQSWLERAVAALTARIEGRLAAGSDVASFTIGDRAVDLIPIKECVELRTRFEQELRASLNPGRISTPIRITMGAG